MSMTLLGAGGFRVPTTPPSVRAVSTGSVASGTSLTLPTRAAGDVLVAFVVTGGTVPTANAGWTRQINETADNLASKLGVYTRTSDGTDNTPVSSSLMSGAAYTIFSVQNPTTGYDTSASGKGNSGSIVAPTVTAAGSASVLLTGYMRASATGTITPPGTQTATTPVVDAGMIPSITLRCGYESLSASGATGTRTATQSSGTFWVGANVIVK